MPVNRPRMKQVQEETNQPIEKDNYVEKPVTYKPSLDVLDRLANSQREESGEEKGQKIEESLLARGLKTKAPKEPKTLKEFGAVAVKKNSRQSIIISLLRRKKEIMIKDVSPLIHGCSEKTIQRELLSMVDKGILKKIGEKRWSRYSLA